MAVYCRDKKPIVWAFFFLLSVSWIFSIYDSIVILLLGLYVPTKLALSLQKHTSLLTLLSYSVGDLTTSVPSKDIYQAYTCSSFWSALKSKEPSPSVIICLFFISSNSLYLWQGKECQRHLSVSFLESLTLYSASLSGAKMQFNTLCWLCFWLKSRLTFFIHLGLSWFIYANGKIFSFSKSDDPSSISHLVAKKSLLLVNPGNFIPRPFQRLSLSLASIGRAVHAVTFKYPSQFRRVVEGWIRALYAAIDYITTVKSSFNLSRGAVQSVYFTLFHEYNKFLLNYDEYENNINVWCYLKLHQHLNS